MVGILMLTCVGNWIRGRYNVYAALPFIVLAGYVVGDWRVALISGDGFWLWQCYPWGHLQGLGHFVPDRPEAKTSILLRRVAFGNVHLAHALGHCLFILPTVLMLHYDNPIMWLCAPAFGLVTMLSYVVGWRADPYAGAIMIGEILTGLWWGFIIMGAVM